LHGTSRDAPCLLASTITHNKNATMSMFAALRFIPKSPALLVAAALTLLSRTDDFRRQF